MVSRLFGSIIWFLETRYASYVFYTGNGTLGPFWRGKVSLSEAVCHIGNVLRRFDRVGDLFAGVLKRPQRMEKALQKLSGLMTAK